MTQTRRVASRRSPRTGWMVAAPVVGLAIAALPAPAGAGPLEPDLQVLSPAPIRLCQESPNAISTWEACVGSGRTVVRLHGYVANAGTGPLEYAPVPPADDIPADCHGDGNPDVDGDGVGDDNDVLIKQRVFDDADANGVFSRAVDTSSFSVDVGCRYYHPEHDHYHVEAFARYSLQSIATGEVARSGGKISFCVADTDPFDITLPGAPPASGGGFYSDDDCDSRLSTQGISVGWSDRYGWKLSGQEIDVTNMPGGEYCLLAEADPEDRLDETIETNNAHRRQLDVNPAAAPATGYVELPSTEGCDFGEPPPPPASRLQPDVTLASGWRVFGAPSAWSALDDGLTPPATPDASDYVRPKSRGRAAEVGLNTVAADAPKAATAYVFARTSGSSTRLRIRVRWGGVTRERSTIGTAKSFAWRQIPISPVPPNQVALDDLSMRFTSLDGRNTIVRAAFVEVELP